MNCSDSQQVKLLYGVDVLKGLRTLEDKSVHCVITSPPYWGLRNYGVNGQIGLEKSFPAYINKMVKVFDDVRRVLRDDGTCWVNMGDTYAGGSAGNVHRGLRAAADKFHPCKNKRAYNRYESTKIAVRRMPSLSLQAKDLIGVPWRLAFALQESGWILRSDIIWSKPNPMPESILDRPTKAHEYIFLLAKQNKYFYDAEAIKEETTGNAHPRGVGVNPKAKVPSGWDTGPGAHNGKGGRYRHKQNESFSAAVKDVVLKRNKRTVWEIGTQPFPQAHFATFPEEIPRLCIMAGCPQGGVVLDPFSGSGTTGAVAVGCGRRYIGIDLNKKYLEMARQRIGIFAC